ncbi:MAG TPA: hypothetical protein VL098_15145 [Flavipsychrobacter sp.]|nr:hypothetical protein [Flavipsychrobacter sp.]
MKARLKTILLSSIGVISAFSLVTFSSCEDKCKTISCAYDGICSEGKCICKTGYEGPQCEVLSRTKFMGPWTVTENGSITDASKYSISVEAGVSDNEVRIINLRNFFEEPINAFVKGDTIYIPEQDVENQTVVGNGWIEDDNKFGDNGRVLLKYKVTDKSTNESDDFGADGGDPSIWNR